MKKNTKKNLLIAMTILSGLIIGSGILYYMNTQTAKDTIQQIEHKKKPENEKHQVVEEETEKIDDKNINEKRAIETLERKETEIKNDDAVKQIENAITYINDSKESIHPNIENHLSLTNSGYITTIKMLLKQDYKLNNIKMYNSKHDNVLQFIFSLEKEGEETLVFTGNYVPNTEQIEIANIKGNLPTSGSPTTSEHEAKQDDNKE